MFQFIGKTKILLQLESENFRSLAGTFGDLEKTQEEVDNVGIQLFISRLV